MEKIGRPRFLVRHSRDRLPPLICHQLYYFAAARVISTDSASVRAAKAEAPAVLAAACAAASSFCTGVTFESELAA